MMGEPEVPRLIAVSAPVKGRRYELWRTPQVKPGWHLYGYQDGLEICRKPMGSETKGRDEFEASVERAMQVDRILREVKERRA